MRLFRKLFYKIDWLLKTNISNYFDFYFPTEIENEQRRKRQELYSEFLEENDIYFDVGANYGNRIVPLTKSPFKIIAVEPQPKCHKFLKRVFQDRVQVIPKGLGANDGEILEMQISDSSTLSTFSKDFIKEVKGSGRFSQYKWQKKIKIEMTTLDKLIEEYGTPKFIKIDVEGFELDVIKGLSIPVKYISFEYTTPELLSTTEECLVLLRDIYSNKLKCNYSIGESMKLELDEWISMDSMLNHIKTDEFIQTRFGDVYICATN